MVLRDDFRGGDDSQRPPFINFSTSLKNHAKHAFVHQTRVFYSTRDRFQEVRKIVSISILNTDFSTKRFCKKTVECGFQQDSLHKRIHRALSRAVAFAWLRWKETWGCSASHSFEFAVAEAALHPSAR